MFKNINFTTFGRLTMHEDWHIYPSVGINRIYYIHSGYATYIGKSEKQILSPGNLYLFPQNLEFRISMDKSQCFDHTYFDFFCAPPIILDNILSFNPDENPLIKSVAHGLFALAQSHPMRSIANRHNYYEATTSALSVLLDVIYNECGFKILPDFAVTGTLEYIHSHFFEKISVSSLAAKVHTETNVFIRKFKKYTGTTPYRYIKNLRLNYAISLIQSKEYTLDEVAILCGYADAPSLSHAIASNR